MRKLWAKRILWHDKEAFRGLVLPLLWILNHLVLQLEDAIANFMHTDESITYSDASSCVSSAIPAFAKRNDLLIVDAGISHFLRVGVRLSRSKVVYFQHNNAEHLEMVLKGVLESDKQRDKSLSQRRFIVIEGLYRDTGDIAPLKDIVQLAQKYKFRIMLDDSMGWGVLGKEGRGTVEHFGLSSTCQVVCFSLVFLT